jgi:glucose/arabinose dehydrogenase/RNase P/RNase MRP subunit p29
MLLPVAPATAAPPPDFQTSLVVGDGLDGPSGFKIAPDGRIFLLERAGKVKIVKDGRLLPVPFVDLPSEATGDRGLIGIAFDPGFDSTNNWVYFYYTGHDLRNHLVRFDAGEDVGRNGPYELYRTTSLSQLLHVGGAIGFGPDGKLYFAVGDNGDGANAQKLDNPHGKILRINPDGTIPTDNPFYGQPGQESAIWAYGFRNPWRFQFDPETGELYGGDVGNFSWEELNHIVKGGNYGWPLHEGLCTGDCAGLIDPINAYPHYGGFSASVTGGPVYRGAMFPPEYRGNLFFGDYAQGFIKRAELNADSTIATIHDFDTNAGSVVDLQVAADGSMYYATYYPGALYRVVYNTRAHGPIANATSTATRGTEPLTVDFSSAGSYDPDGDPVSYRWDFGDGTTSDDANPAKTFTSKGVYTVRLTVSSGDDHIPAHPIVIQVGIAPTLTVAAPAEGRLYRAGDTITYNAFASDAAGFDLNDADISTVVRLHHGQHFHPFAGPLRGRVGSFTVPTTGEASADTSYEITVTATDGNGLSTSKTVTVRPRKAHLIFATSPPGLGLTLDGVPIASPYDVDGIAGFTRQLAAPATAIASDGTPLQFAGWSDHQAIRHTITTPDADTTYTATYRPATPFTATFYNNIDLAGAPVLTRQDARIDFVWRDGAPDPAVPADQFSARWTATRWFGAGRYTFSTATDDGVRLYLDHRRVIDEWRGQPGAQHDFTTDLGEGNHTITMEYFEYSGSAVAMLTWDSTLDQPNEQWHAQYWNLPAGSNAIPGGSPAVTRDEPAIDHDWGTGSPDPAIGVDRFAARWTRTVNLAPGRYRFIVAADDGVRLTIDGVRVIDRWVDQAAADFSVELPIDSGPHSVVVEYYENSGGALARFTYQQIGDLPEPSAYHGEYWNTPDLPESPVMPTGDPDLVRDDPAIEFEWAHGSPAPSISHDDFMARWTRTDVLSAGVYRFTVAADDGIRVFVDNTPIVNLWQRQHTTLSVNTVLLAGPHVIRVDYFEDGLDALAKVDYQRIGDVVPTDPGFQAEYFGNQDLSGAPALVRQDPAVDFAWGHGSPGDGTPVDHFSARWTKAVVLPAGAYAFTVRTDDGVRLRVDGTTILERWVNQGATTYTVARQLTEGTHDIVLEYYEAAGDASAQFSYAPTDETPSPVRPFTAEYFANPDLSGPPAVTRSDERIDFQWASGAPDPALPADQFSVRWTRSDPYEAATYRFTVTADDGIRVRVDGATVIDGWRDQASTTYTADVPLTAGDHTVVVEYYERGGAATAQFTENRL